MFVLVFFLFVVMCLKLNTATLASTQQIRFRWWGSLAGLMFLSSFGLAFTSFIKAQTMDPSSIRGTIEIIGQILFTDYLLPFELTSLLLLIAIFGIVSLAQGALSTGKDSEKRTYCVPELLRVLIENWSPIPKGLLTAKLVAKRF